MKPVSLFFVITGILGIGSMDSAGLEYSTNEVGIDVTTTSYNTNIHNKNTFYIASITD